MMLRDSFKAGNAALLAINPTTVEYRLKAP